MIEEIQILLSKQLLPGMLLGVAICFFFLRIPLNPELKNYRFARRVLGYAYLAYALVLFFRPSSLPNVGADWFARDVILLVSCLQAYLFTHTLITLLDIRFLTRLQIMREGIPILLFIVATTVVRFTCPPFCLELFFYVLVVYYIGLLVHYVRLFNSYRRAFLNKMDNYYSDGDSWIGRQVTFWFYIAFSVGILGLLYAVFASLWTSLFFFGIVAIFYVAFSVNFLNYPEAFLQVVSAIAPKDEAGVVSLTVAPCEKELELMDRIDALMKEQELYKQQNLSINDLGSLLQLNPKVISTTINRCKEQNFKSYISDLRVHEAIRLMQNDCANALTIEAIGANAGFSSKSNFYSVFKKSTGYSPLNYLKKE